MSLGKSFNVVSHDVCQLTSLNKLVLPMRSTTMSLEDLRNLSKLIELEVAGKPEIKGGSMSSWSEMTKLKLLFDNKHANRDDAAVDILPQNMQNMKNLQSLHLSDYLGVSLPNCISQFQNLKNLCLYSCSELKELPALQIGSEAALSGCFPVLERLELWSLGVESIVWNEGAMLKLQILEIACCEELKTLRMEKLPNLRDLNILECDELKELFIGSVGFPMLETLKLNKLPNLDSVPSRMWSKGTMPKLQFLHIIQCLLLRRLSLENFPNLEEIQFCNWNCQEEVEVEIGSFPMLERLTLGDLQELESIARPSTVWNERTMPKLQILRIIDCPLLMRLPMGMDKLSNLREIVGKLDWWEGIIWKDDDIKIKLSQLFREYEDWEYDEYTT